MESNRIRFIISRHRLLIAAVAIVGAIAAAFFANVRNNSIEARFTAIAPGTFDQITSLSIDEAELSLDQAQIRAVEANAEEMLRKPETRVVDVNNDLLRLEFRATESSIDAAQAAAETMRERWLTGPGVGEDLANEQEQILVLMQDVAARIAASGQTIDPLVEAELERLGARIAALSARITTLDIEKLFPGERSVETIDAEIGLAEAGIAEARARIDAISPDFIDPFSTEGVKRRALEGEFAALEERYKEISLELSRVLTPTSDTIELFDDTPAPLGLQVSAALGLMLGMGLATTVLAFNDRTRQPVLESTDLPALRALGRVRARIHGDPAEYWYHTSQIFWYHTTDEAARKAEVQAIRAALQGSRSSGAVTIAIAGLETESADVHDLAADLAVSITLTQKQVMLIDADFDSPGEGAEYRSRGVTLADIISSKQDIAEIDLSHDHILGLRPIPVGQPSVDPSDAIGGPRMARFIKRAAAEFDLTIVVLPDVRTPVAKAMLNHVDAAILALTVGSTPHQTVMNVVNDWDTTGASLLGFALLEPRPVWNSIRRSWTSWRNRASQSKRAAEEAAEEERIQAGLPKDPI